MMFIVKNIPYLLIFFLVTAIHLVAFETPAAAWQYGGWHRYLGGWDAGGFAGRYGWHGGTYGGWDRGLYDGRARSWYGYRGPGLYNNRYESGWYDPYSHRLRVSGLRGGYRDYGDRYRQSRYAAIAFSPSTGSYGIAGGFNTRAGAERAAIGDCGTSDARVLVWARNRWVALALGDQVGIYGWAWAGTRARARQLALQGCMDQTYGCNVAVSVWSGN